MFKKLLFTGIGVALVAMPLMASAASIADLQAQIANLVAQIRVLESGSSTAGVGSWADASSTVTSPAMPSMPCYEFTRSLGRGAKGDDVKSLQQYLYAQGFFAGYVTGYFGAQTEAALQNWQAHEGIATHGNAGFGIFGPLSRGHLKDLCGTPGKNTTQSFSADPQSGSAPLTTTFTTSDSITASSTYSVDFGDGTNAQMTKGSCVGITAIVGGQGGIRCSYTVQHTYASNGTYTAKLYKQREWNCPNGMMCAMMMPAPQVVGTLTISVGTTTGTNFSASPTSGNAPLAVQFTSSAPQGSTIGSNVNFGDGTSGHLGFVPVCSSCNAMGIVSHTYQSAGTYTAILTDNNNAQIGSVTITVGSPTTTSSFSASPTSGNAPLPVTFTENGFASGTYLVNFGDNTSATLTVPTIECSATPCVPGPQSVSHTYQNSGTYTATVTTNNCACPANGVCNCPNMQILGTATVNVGTSTLSNDQRINAPASVTLTSGGIAEVRNKNIYFTLTSLGTTTATIQITPVGCWNSFPSDPTPQVRCMIAVFPVPPATLSVGQTYTASTYAITLTNLTSTSATFQVGSVSTTY
ncbi:MAG TPA: peptidoglycan-binding protein [Candidatus Paceibacterota bacterium]|nr:peptidoglycan-binding protein [Candidatus Paceibacterota bacterium]